jgi:hypothetical protein
MHSREGASTCSGRIRSWLRITVLRSEQLPLRGWAMIMTTTPRSVVKYELFVQSRCGGVTGAPITLQITLQSVMGWLVHTGLGSSSLVAHVLHYSPAPTRTAL